VQIAGAAAIVFGGSSGLGEATARRLEHFAQVINVNLLGTINALRLVIRLDGAIRMAPR